MRLLARHRPSPSIIVAVAALCLSVIGTAAAGVASFGVLDQGEKKQVRKISRKQANGRITARAKNLSVKHATTADRAAIADRASTADSATSGAPLAYAAVEADGTLTNGYAVKNIDAGDITHPDEGAYCFQLPFTPRTAAANAQAEGDEDGILSIDLVRPFTDCPENAEAEVRNFDSNSNADQNDSFLVQFDG